MGGFHLEGTVKIHSLIVSAALVLVPSTVAAAGDQIELDLALAEQRLVQAQLEADTHDLDARTRIEHAQIEVELAKAKLVKFEKLDAPNRRASAELDLRSAKDRAQEAADELKQIELMYEGQDLQDLTAEFVVSRGRRNAERAAARIAIQERELDALVNHALPLERKQLALELERKRAGLKKAEMDAKSGALAKRIGVMKAESELVKLREKAANPSATPEVEPPEPPAAPGRAKAEKSARREW